jgi:non-specific serine/threonine protein kinase
MSSERLIHHHNLPTQVSRFIGRDQELREIRQRLHDHRLITLTGTGGTGKTRLALEAASAEAERFADGVWLIDLAALSAPELVVEAIANTLALTDTPVRSPLEQLGMYLESRQALLLLDNCEHLIEACAHVARVLLARCPRLFLLTTSREPLAIKGEAVLRVAGLSLPDPMQPVEWTRLPHYDAIQLFIERAQDAELSFRLTAANASVVTEVCRQLDGIPLALELAAMRVRGMGLVALAERLDQRFRLLTGGERNALPRQQTLRATIDWSYDLLSPSEQRMLRRLAVFAGGCSLAAAEAVCAGDGIECEEPLELLVSLVNKSLVVTHTLERGEVRYSLLETIRQYAQEKLIAAGEWQATRDRHLLFFLREAQEVELKLGGQEQRRWLKVLDDEHDNIRAALAWSLEQQRIELGLRIANALFRFWDARGYMREANIWYERLLCYADDKVPLAVRSRALTFSSFVAHFLGDEETTNSRAQEAVTLCEAAGEESKPLLAFALSGLVSAAEVEGDLLTAYTILERVIALCRDLDDRPTLGMSLYSQGKAAIALGDYHLARAPLEEGLAIFRADGDTYRMAHTLNGLADLALCEGHLDQARALYEDSLALWREVGAARDVLVALHNLAHISLRQSNLERAHVLFRESLEGQRGGNNGEGAVQGLLGFAGLAAATGLIHESARLFGAASASKAWNSAVLWPAKKVEYELFIGLVRSQLSDAEFAAEQASGRAMSLEQAVSYALHLPFPLPAQTRVEPLVELTRREREVVVLIARGLSNGEIAEQLILSKRTVEKHVANILSTLGLTNRAQIVRWAIEHGLAISG